MGNKSLVKIYSFIKGNDSSKSPSSSTSMNTTFLTTSADPTKDNKSAQDLLQNILLVWLDSTINESEDKCHQNMTQFRSIINNINTFTDPTECVNFLCQIQDRKVIMLVSDTLAQKIIPEIHDIGQLHCIYIFCYNKALHEPWAKNWAKVKEIFTEIDPFCKSLRNTVHQIDQDSISVSIVPAEAASKQNLDQLDPTFMYTQLLKEILCEFDYDAQTIKDFVAHCRQLYADNSAELETIAMFEQEYCLEKAVWWYTKECFLYRMLNKALRNHEIDNVIKLGFFIRDLHQQLEMLHAKQYGNQQSKSFTVYRGQSLSKVDFDKLLKTPGGLFSFNNFLSTSEDEKVSLEFVKGGTAKPGFVSLLFVMKIDISVSSAPFALLNEHSFFQSSEKEILFSTHTVFRIGEIKPLDDKNDCWHVALTLTHDNDPDLNAITQCMRNETEGSTGWHRLGILLMKMGQYNKAEDVYNILLNKTMNDDVEKAYLNHQLGWTKRKKGDYEEALRYYENGRKLREKILPTDHPDFILSYNSIGDAYKGMGDYSKALSHYEKALEICEKALPLNHPQLAISNKNIGDLYNDLTEYSKALSYYEKALEINQKALPSNHPDLATSNNNMGDIYTNMGEYSQALPYYKKVLEISQKILPQNHPDFATFYNNIGSMHEYMGEYSKALSYYEKALENSKESLSENHPNLVSIYNNIGLVYFNMGEFSQAIPHYKSALEVCKNSLRNNHPNWAITYNNIGLVYLKQGQYSEALSYYEKDLEISMQTLPPNHFDLAPTYNSMGFAYLNMNEYSKALSYYEKAFKICEKALPSNHPTLATAYNNIGNVHNGMGQHLKALSFYEKALEIRGKCLPSNHPNLATSYNNIGLVYKSIGEYSKALSFYERAVECAQQSLSENHPDLQMYKKNTEDVKLHL